MDIDQRRYSTSVGGTHVQTKFCGFTSLCIICFYLVGEQSLPCYDCCRARRRNRERDRQERRHSVNSKGWSKAQQTGLETSVCIERSMYRAKYMRAYLETRGRN